MRRCIAETGIAEYADRKKRRTLHDYSGKKYLPQNGGQTDGLFEKHHYQPCHYRRGVYDV